MSSSSDAEPPPRPPEWIEAAARPLRFAARNNFANLGIVRGLEAGLTRALAEAERAGAGDPAGLDEVRRRIAGLDGAPAEDKSRRVRELLGILDQLAEGRGAAKREGREASKPEGGATRSEGRGASRPERRGVAKREGRGAAKPEGHVQARPLADPAEPAAKVARAPRVPSTAATLELPLAAIAGVGPKTAERLAARGLRTVEDALLFLPRRYEDRRSFTRVADLRPGEHASVVGTVLASAIRFAGRGRRVFEVAVREDPPSPGAPPSSAAPGGGSETLSCRWFRFREAAMVERFTRGQRVVVSGAPIEWGASRQMVHPEVVLLTPDAEAKAEGLVPIYPEIEAVPERTLRQLLVSLARAAAMTLADPLPPPLRERLALPGIGPAIYRAHVPEPEVSAPLASLPPLRPGTGLHRRLVFDELFFFQLAVALERSRIEEEPGLVHAPRETGAELAAAMFPFPLTGAQSRAIAEIAADLARPRPMSRLLQGDVGAGKTAVALVAAGLVIRAGRQVAMLAPTEILAEQHFHGASRAARVAGLSVGLLTGSTRARERRELLSRLARGDLDLLVGTHAILEPDVVFSRLGLAIVDEQHRFGVEQRARLRAKTEGPRPDVLVMTATPIPRTLAMALYGELEITVLDELPPGRSPTVTRVFAGARGRAEVHELVERALGEGRQAFFVYPLVEATEKSDLAAATEALAELRARFARFEVALLHGRMRSDEKQAVMARFVSGEAQVLVSTTVIEVGVDVPNATVMVLEHAERFGLSQIHQLRGRVGRGAHAGSCLLVAGAASAEAAARLAVLESTNDGFEIAEHDLRARGPGELLGTRQSGLPELVVADLLRDVKILEEARAEALALVRGDPSLTQPAHANLRAELVRRFGARAQLASVG